MVLVLVISACGSSPDSATRVTTGVIASTAEATRIAGTARMRGTVTNTDADGSVFAYVMSGASDFESDATRLESRDDPAASPGGRAQAGRTETIVIKDVLYMRGFAGPVDSEKKWYRLPVSGALAQLQATAPNISDPITLLDRMSAVGTVETLGTERIRGVVTTHCRITFDAAKEKALRPKEFQRSGPSLNSQGRTDIWIDAAGRTRRLQARFTNSRRTSTFDVEFYDFGTPVRIKAPPAADIIDVPARP